jgi:phage tail sheath gpL-like
VTISFNNIPSTTRTPSTLAEFDSSRASSGPALLAFRALIIGQKIAAGTAGTNTIVRCANSEQAAGLAGRGSLLHRQAIAWFNVNKSTELYLGVLADNGSGVAATKTLTFTGTATATGTLNLYIGGERVQVAVTSGDINTVVAAAANAAINLLTNLPVTAGVASGVVTLTARNKGVAGQDLDVRANYNDGETTPAGVTLAIANVVAGVTNPVLTTLISAMGDTWYNVIAHPYYDSTSLTALETELSSRFGPTRMIDGVAFTSSPGTQSALGTLGDSRNSPHSCIVAAPGESPVTQPAEFAAAVAAAAALSAAADPARPFQTLALPGVKAPAEADLFTVSERDLELHDGISTSKVAPGGVVQIERLVTTFQTNAAGGADTAYLDATTMFTLAYLRYAWRAQILARYPRHKVAADGTRFGAGQAVVTPRTMKAEALLWFRAMEELGLVEDFAQFKTDLVIERNASDANRVDALLSPNLINQLVVTATKFQFIL